MSVDRRTVNAVMAACFNYFETGYRKTDFVIENGRLTDSSGGYPAENEWVAITGSVNHDGVYEIAENGRIVDMSAYEMEAFHGKIHFLRPPVSFMELCEEINFFTSENDAPTAETVRVGQYSESNPKTWKEAFSDRISLYKRNPLECDIRV